MELIVEPRIFTVVVAEMEFMIVTELEDDIVLVSVKVVVGHSLYAAQSPGLGVPPDTGFVPASLNS
jgi:hypothetical protein